jgi:hypothetical protein
VLQEQKYIIIRTNIKGAFWRVVLSRGYGKPVVDIDSYGSRGEGVWANWERTYEKRTDEE